MEPERKGCVVVAEPRKMNCSGGASGKPGVSSKASSDVFAATKSGLKEATDRRNRHEQFEAGDKKTAGIDMFPWMTEFRAQCRSSIASQGPSSLIKLIRFFNRNVSSNVNDCYKKSSRAAKLKELIKEALLLFVYFHRFEQPQDQNRAVYLEQMSDLLAMYIDLELVASKRDVEPQHGKISARLVSCLYVYLENSTEHLLDTLIKVQLVNETFSNILDAIISKVFKIIPPHPETEIMYVRYLLVYRLWKKVHSNLAVKKQINTSAISSLRSLPANLPATLLEQVLPAATTATTTNPTDPQSTKFYLCQHFDLRRACSQFLQYCRRSRGDEEKGASPAAGDITERDQRLKCTITSETNKVEPVNTKVSKSSNSVDKSTSVKNMINIPFSKLEINSNKMACSAVSNNINDKTLVRSAVLNKNRKLKQLNDIVLIDLTDEEVTKIVKCKRRRRIDWLEDAKRNIDAKIKETALKRDKDTVNASLKITKEQLEDTSRRSNIRSPSVERTQLESKLLHSSPNPIISETKSSTSNQQVLESVKSPIMNAKSISSPPDSSTSKLVCYDSDSIPEENNQTDKLILEDNSTMVIERSDSMNVTSSKTLRPSQEKEKVSALRDADVSCKDEQPADSTVSSMEVLKEVSSSIEEKKPVLTGSCSVIRESSLTAFVANPVVEKVESKKIMENRPVNSNATKTDCYPNEQKVQQALITGRRSVSNINESHTQVEKLKEKGNKSVNSEQVAEKLNLTQVGHIKQTKEKNDVNSSSRQLQADSSEVPTTSNGYYDIPESDIDGLTLLASVSAQQQVSANKKNELKVKPYSSLQQKPKHEDNNAVINRIVGMYPENALEKVALQVEVTSTEVVSSTVNKQHHQDTPSSDLLSYIIDETIQNNLESNDNANVILNGETVMLLQKSPNSNLYIINKAAVDNLSSGKINYNSDEEDSTKVTELEETKCCQQGMMIKHDPDDVSQRGRSIKPDPDYSDMKSSALIGHDDSKHQNQSGYELHYAGYSVPPPGSYCTFPNIHHPSTGCACVSCAYCRQVPFYLPATHATQSVQTNPAVQEKRSSKKTEAAILAKLYDDQLLTNIEKNLLDGKQQQHHLEQVVVEGKEIDSRFEHVEYYLPATHATQTVQINPAVQEKRSSKNTETAAKLAKLYDDQLNCSIENNLLEDMQQQQQVAEEQKVVVSKFEHVDSKLPLKKRLKAQRMMSMDFENQGSDLPLNHEAVTPTYPGMLMMSIANVDVQSDNPPHELGAVVEVTTATVKSVKSRAGRKERTMNNKTNNQNVPNCFPRKSNNKKKRLCSTDEEVENSGVSAPKKSRKSNDSGVKQTRSSRRIVPTVNYVYPEIDTECNPSGKRKKKRSNR